MRVLMGTIVASVALSACFLSANRELKIHTPDDHVNSLRRNAYLFYLMLPLL